VLTLGPGITVRGKNGTVSGTFVNQGLVSADTAAGTINLNGTLNVSLINGFAPVFGNSFQVLTFASRTGDFATINGLDLGTGLRLIPVYDGSSLTLITDSTTTTSISSSANPSVVGQSVTFTATVSANASGVGSPTGTVTFTLDGTAQAPVPLSGGQATLTVSNLSIGSHTVSAAYNPTGFFLARSSAILTQTVNQANTTTAVSSSVNPSNVGQAVIFTATVTVVAPGAGTPTGSVTFQDGGWLSARAGEPGRTAQAPSCLGGSSTSSKAGAIVLFSVFSVSLWSILSQCSARRRPSCGRTRGCHPSSVRALSMLNCVGRPTSDTP
jgi:hypothetical protein